MKIKKLKINTNSGFVALFAVLLSMLILAMTMGITNTSIKEAQMSVQAKDGHIALFSADSGIECALYGDLQKYGFGDASNPPPATNIFECIGANSDGSVGQVVNTSNHPKYEFMLYLSDTQCTRVFVDKNYPEYNTDGTLNPNITNTKIDSYGYNVSCNEVFKPKNSKKVERALRVMYPN